MSELAPGSPWKAIVLEAFSAFAISRTPPALSPVTVLSAGCFARWIAAVNRPPIGEKPRKIRDLRRSAARARRVDQILLAGMRACYSIVRNFWRSGI